MIVDALRRCFTANVCPLGIGGPMVYMSVRVRSRTVDLVGGQARRSDRVSFVPDGPGTDGTASESPSVPTHLSRVGTTDGPSGTAGNRGLVYWQRRVPSGRSAHRSDATILDAYNLSPV